MQKAFSLIPLLLVLTASSVIAADQPIPGPSGMTPEHQQQMQEQRKNMQEAHDKMLREMGAKRLKESVKK